GHEAFALHDTYGFPFELTEEIAASRNITVDRDGFGAAMEAQRERARAASRFLRDPNAEQRPWTKLTDGAHSEFLGYDSTQATGLSVRFWRESGEDVEVVLDRTPCYPESGGQVADQGFLEGPGVRAGLLLVYREGDHIVHRVSVAVGLIKDLIAIGAKGLVNATVDRAKRQATERHHTATHLLHAALRRVLGEHVHQAGSMVAPDRLRFDYSHFESPSPLHVTSVEQIVNDWIMGNQTVSWREMPIAEAKAQGAMALFGEKYGERVRMVTVDGVADAGIEPSRELCGGTHVKRTGDIGLFVITEETAVASGVRRIEALCGPAARTWLLDSQGTLLSILEILQTPQFRAIEAVGKLKDEIAQLRKQVNAASQVGMESQLVQLAQSATAEANGRWVVARIDTPSDTNTVRDAADKLRGAIGRGAAVLAIVNEEKFSFLALVSDDLVAEKKLRADELVRAVARITGGSGGGKPHLSLAGGRDMGKLDEALDHAREQLKKALS
ncbi:MAG: alanine--tRNA ligase, partial [Candidatus Eisenbacteria bacterium]|nr:alanine--tRNA ligase [Candidatus Eisenbacteria bacterium]